MQSGEYNAPRLAQASPMTSTGPDSAAHSEIGLFESTGRPRPTIHDTVDRNAVIMIVDDDPYIVEMTKWRLSLDGFNNFITISDPTQVLDQINLKKPDIILIDVFMPKISGLKLLELIRSDSSMRDLPIVILTSSESEETKRMALSLGANDFLTKSVDASEMVARVRNILIIKSHRDHLACYAAQLEGEFMRRTEIEIELVRARRIADDANRIKSEFLANMSHEIRTPLTAILGYAEILQDFDIAHDERVEAAKTIFRNGSHLLELINDLFDFTRLEAGRLDVDLAPCSPLSLIREVQSLMRSRADARGIELQFTFDGPIPETIRTDERRVRQILFNLIGNAIKFTHSGCVEVRVQVAHDASGSGSTIHFNVIDTGIGMSAQQAAKLFLPFSQVDLSIDRNYGGTGLGLTISRRLATLLDGDVELVQTKPDGGSHFRATIPTGSLEGVRMITDVNQPINNESSKLVRHLEQILNVRVLLAEDGIDNQRLITSLLTKAGADVTLAENGRDAVDAAMTELHRGTPFDIILMDIQMPILDGHSATRELRAKNYPGAIVALTANALPSDRAKAIDAGCTDFVSKPVTRDKLITVVAMHCRMTTAASSP